MARDHAQIRLSMWDDDDFRALSGNAQHLYLMLLTHSELSYCGVMDWRPAKLSGRVHDWTADTVRAAADELIERLYVLVDEDTEEVLVRSFVRRDGLMKQPKMATAMATAHAAVGSVPLRAVVVWELQRLHREDPGLNGWGSEKASALLSKPSTDPSTYPCGKGSGNPSAEGSRKGSASPVLPSSCTPSSPTPSSSSPDSADKSAPAGRSRGTRIPDDFAIDDDMRSFARNLGFNDGRIDAVTESFCDFWRGKPGAGGVKLDWLATWRNWMRREAERLVLVPSGPSGSSERTFTRRELDEILGQDSWQVPAPPPELDPEDHAGYRSWCQQQTETHRAERVQRALAVLGRQR